MFGIVFLWMFCFCFSWFCMFFCFFFFSSRRRHTRCGRDWSSDVCSSDLLITSVGVIYASFGNENFLAAIAYFVLAIACVGAAIKYTVGNSAYGYRGLGDVFVFIFFGLVSTLGTYYLFGHSLDWKIVFPAVGIGLLSMSVLNMNNMRDVENDTIMGKNTLVV